MATNTIFLIVGILGAVFGAIDIYRSQGQNFTAIGLVIVSVGLVIIGLK